MKVYHATPVENRITVEEGLHAMVTDKITLSDEQIQAEGVFFFTSLEYAEDFGVDCCGGEYAIFSADLDMDDCIEDPEYDGEAVFFAGSVKNVEFVTSNI